MILWTEMSSMQKNELIAKKVLGWKKIEKEWYRINDQKQEEGPLTLPLFTTDPSTIWLILDNFDSYQITKMFPEKYRTIIQANKNVGYSLQLNDSVCKAALIATGFTLN
jgi:hypothetical protein